MSFEKIAGWITSTIIVLVLALIFLEVPIPSFIDEFQRIEGKLTPITTTFYYIGGIITLISFFIAFYLLLFESLYYYIVLKFVEGYNPRLIKSNNPLSYKRVKFFKVILFCIAIIFSLIHIWLFFEADLEHGSDPGAFIMNLSAYNTVFSIIIKSLIISSLVFIIFYYFRNKWQAIRFKSTRK